MGEPSGEPLTPEQRRSLLAYRFYRQQQHNTRLRDADKVEINEEVMGYYQSVRELWTQVFGEEVRFAAR